MSNKSPFSLFASNMQGKYSIKDLERLSGIKAHTVRIWEQRYTILKPSRTDTNIRTYDDEDLRRILNISLLNNSGYKISAIARLADEDLVNEVNKVLSESRTENLNVDSLVISLLNSDEERFEATINNSIMRFGFESTIENIVFPFLRQLGNMWQVGVISPAQEHYISNLVRQKIIVGLDRIVPAKHPDPKTFLFFLPENELHELGLIYLHYICKFRGHRCLYLGQSLPTEDLVSISANVKPDYLVTVLTCPITVAALDKLVTTIADQITDAKLLISGRLLFTSKEHHLDGNNRRTVFKDFTEFKSLL